MASTRPTTSQVHYFGEHILMASWIPRHKHAPAVPGSVDFRALHAVLAAGDGRLPTCVKPTCTELALCEVASSPTTCTWMHGGLWYCTRAGPHACQDLWRRSPYLLNGLRYGLLREELCCGLAGKSQQALPAQGGNADLEALGQQANRSQVVCAVAANP